MPGLYGFGTNQVQCLILKESLFFFGFIFIWKTHLKLKKQWKEMLKNFRWAARKKSSKEKFIKP